MWPYRKNGNATPTPTNERRVPRRKPTRRWPPEVLSDAEVRALMEACVGPPLTVARNRALIALLYRSGLRLGEALELRPKDVDAAAGSVAVLRAKGGTWRVVGIDGEALAVVGEWLAARAALRLPPTAPLFCTMRGEPIAQGYIRRFLKLLAAKAGIAKRVHAHGLRHTMAAQLRSEGMDIGLISRQLGHVNITTTARYLDHIAPMAVVAAMGKREWDRGVV